MCSAWGPGPSVGLFGCSGPQRAAFELYLCLPAHTHTHKIKKDNITKIWATFLNESTEKKHVYSRKALQYI